MNMHSGNFSRARAELAIEGDVIFAMEESSASKDEAMAPRAATATRFRTFRSYAEHQERMKKKALSTIEENGVGAALERCRALVERIDADLGDKKPEDLDIAALADFQVSLERAASVLSEQLHLSGDDDDDYQNPGAGGRISRFHRP
jgi:hypothetical protein